MEQWKSIEGFEGYYKISTFGRILNEKTKTIKKPSINKYGYMQTPLYRDGEAKNCRVHRLVASAFIPIRESATQVNHINGIKTDNRVENLEWCTGSENIKHAFDNGLKSVKKGIDCHLYGKSGTKSPTAKLVQCTCTGNIMTQSQAAKWLGVSLSLISLMMLNKINNWTNFIKYERATYLN